MTSAAQRPDGNEDVDMISSSPSSSDGEGLGQGHALERQKTNETITHPGDVRINVKGAFIVDTVSPLGTPPPSESFDVDEEEYQHDPKGIRLPHHKAVVSHIAVDVREEIINHQSSIMLTDTRLEVVLQSSSTSPTNQAATSSRAGASISSNSRQTMSIRVLSLCVA